MNVTTSDKVNLIGIVSDEEKNIFKEMLNKLRMINVAIINLHHLNNFQSFTVFFSKFKELMGDKQCFKILYSEIKDDVKNLPSSIDWEGRADVFYAGKKLIFNKDVIRSYWNWKKSL